MSYAPSVEVDRDAVIAPIIGECPAMRRALQLAQRFAPTRMPILLVGATGTGKELFAQHIHRWSGRSGDLVDLNCAALPRDLIEGLLFGRSRGAYTGAVEAAPGLIEAADGGTLFLDELGSLPPEGQAKLLRVLESGEVRRLGETAKRPISIRLISASHVPLSAELSRGAFRLDLYQRVAGLVIELPTLRERGEDIVLLARHFAAGCGCDLGSEAWGALAAYPWPGNVRELAVTIERAAWLSGGSVLSGAAIREAVALGGVAAVPSDHHVGSEHADARRRMLDACAAYGWNAARLAAALAVSRATLYRRLLEFDIRLRDQRRFSQFVARQIENS